MRQSEKSVSEYVVVQFYPWFKFSFLLFLGMVMYDNNMIMSLKQKKRKFEPRIKLNHNKYTKKRIYINGFALSLAVKQRLMEQLWNYLSHVCPIFCKFHKNHRFCRGPLNLLFHFFTLFAKFLNFAEIFQLFSNLQFSQKSQI